MTCGECQAAPAKYEAPSMVYPSETVSACLPCAIKLPAYRWTPIVAAVMPQGAHVAIPHGSHAFPLVAGISVGDCLLCGATIYSGPSGKPCPGGGLVGIDKTPPLDNGGRKRGWKWGYCFKCDRELVPDLDRYAHAGFCSGCKR